MPVYPGAFHDWGEINGVLYIDMRLVDGSNLHGVLRRDGPLDPARATSIVAQVAEALERRACRRAPFTGTSSPRMCC